MNIYNFRKKGDDMSLADELEQFPFPFNGEVYRYSNNSIPLENPNSVEITSTYKEEIYLKRELLVNHPDRCFQFQPYTLKAQWEAFELIIDHLATYYAEKFEFDKIGEDWTFYNKITDEKFSFTFGDATSLPCEPLNFIGKHVQEDLILMMQRDGDLFLDAGQLCFPANWSLAFDFGMSFKDIHKPIPGFKEEGLDDRILNFIMRLEAGSPWWRKNWSLMAGSRLDTSLETFDEWGQDRKLVTKENVGEFVHLRVEVQKLFRLPRTNGILFTIHSHIISLEKLVRKKEWTEQFYRILLELPSEIADYKGLKLFKGAVIDYLKDSLDERDESK
jgi:dimethylamine monooxygenase subunit A